MYGSESVRRRALRTFQGGKLKTSAGNFLPYNGAGAGGVGISLENAPNAQARFYVAGDIRVCENANLAALHTIWMREHNRVRESVWVWQRIRCRAKVLLLNIKLDSFPIQSWGCL